MSLVVWIVSGSVVLLYLLPNKILISRKEYYIATVCLCKLKTKDLDDSNKPIREKNLPIQLQYCKPITYGNGGTLIISDIPGPCSTEYFFRGLPP